MAAARGALPLSGRDLLTVLFLLCGEKDAEIKQTAIATLKNLPAAILKPALEASSLDPHLLELVARVRITDAEMVGQVIAHPNVSNSTLLYLAGNASPEILEAVKQDRELQDNLSAAAHLIHGSSEGRFAVTYCPGKLSRKDIESVNYTYADLEQMLERY